MRVRKGTVETLEEVSLMLPTSRQVNEAWNLLMKNAKLPEDDAIEGLAEYQNKIYSLAKECTGKDDGFFESLIDEDATLILAFYHRRVEAKKDFMMPSSKLQGQEGAK